MQRRRWGTAHHRRWMSRRVLVAPGANPMAGQVIDVLVWPDLDRQPVELLVRLDNGGTWRGPATDASELVGP